MHLLCRLSWCFVCFAASGIFAPISKVTKPGALPVSKTPPPSPMRAMSKGHVDVSRVTARVDTGKSIILMCLSPLC